MRTGTFMPKAAAIGSIALLGLTACSTASNTGDSDQDDTTSSSTQASASSTDAAEETSETQTSSDAAYEDGTYEATGSYQSPGGQESIDVSLTLADGVVTAVDVENPETTNANSLRYQQEFIDGIADVVVGVPIDELEVDRVGGSSLTSGGFMDAVAQIEAEAAV